MEFKLKALGSFISNEDIIYPFDLQSNDDVLTYRSKSTCQILTFYNNINITPTNVQLSCAKTPRPVECPQLNINKTKIFENCDWNEKNYLMLNPYFFTDCTLKNIHYLKCEISPFSERTGYTLACLTSSGILELYNYSLDACELKKIDTNLSELRKNSLQKPNKEITKFDAFRSSLNEISFANFEWCAIPFEDHKLLICVTKSDNIIFYHIQDNTIVEIKLMKIDNVSRNKLKWMDMNDKHYLLITTDKGNLIRYSVDLNDDGTVNDIQKMDLIEGKLKMPVSYLIFDYHASSTIVLCCKGHTLEIFHMSENKIDLVCSKYVDMTITGIVTCDNLKYLISTLNSKIFYMELTAQNDNISLKFHKQLEFEVSGESEDGFNKNTYYGIATSKNNVLVYLSCYPQQAFDHLVNKQPNHISINLFQKYDPFQILINNPSYKLTDYSDCLEAIRFIGQGKFEMSALEQMDYHISISRQFLYYLKIQLVVVNIKLTYYQMKSRNIYDFVQETRGSIKELILVLNATILIKSILKLKKLSDIHFGVIRCSRKLIHKYCNTVTDKEPFKTALDILKPELEPILDLCHEKLQLKKLQQEICSFCQDEIDDDKLECNLNHKLPRCVLTTILVSLGCLNYCRQCKESVSSLETLSLIVEDYSEINILLCPLCDSKLILNE